MPRRPILAARLTIEAEVQHKLALERLRGAPRPVRSRSRRQVGRSQDRRAHRGLRPACRHSRLRKIVTRRPTACTQGDSRIHHQQSIEAAIFKHVDQACRSSAAACLHTPTNAATRCFLPPTWRVLPVESVEICPGQAEASARSAALCTPPLHSNPSPLPDLTRRRSGIEGARAGRPCTPHAHYHQCSCQLSTHPSN